MTPVEQDDQGSGGRPSAERRFGRTVRELRKARGWSQADLAQALRQRGHSMHQTMIAKTEIGTRPVRLNEAEDLAAVFGMGLTELLAWSEEDRGWREVQGFLNELRAGLRRLDAEHDALTSRLRVVESEREHVQRMIDDAIRSLNNPNDAAGKSRPRPMKHRADAAGQAQDEDADV